MADIERDWNKFEKRFSLDMDKAHTIRIKREAIPIILVPGIMGSRLVRRSDNEMVWDPDSAYFMLTTYRNISPTNRRNLIIGRDKHEKDYLKVAFEGDRSKEEAMRFFNEVSWKTYGIILKRLWKMEQKDDWGPLKKLFKFPIYAYGYNWTNSNRESGDRLRQRIEVVIERHNNENTSCKQVILVTHSMGGLVARSCIAGPSGIADKILGVIHTVQPVTGSAATYYRMKSGFTDSSSTLNRILGNTSLQVTPILASAPGPLELLPTQNYKDDRSRKDWLRLIDPTGKEVLALPKDNPYEDIYKEKDRFWRLVDPYLIESSSNPFKAYDSWDNYVELLNSAKAFHEDLKLTAHTNTATVAGVGTAAGQVNDCIEYKFEFVHPMSSGFSTSNFLDVLSCEFSTSDFLDLCTGKRGTYTAQYAEKSYTVILEDPATGIRLRGQMAQPAGGGDGTVSENSGNALKSYVSKRLPGPLDVKNLDHSDALKVDEVGKFVVDAIKFLAKIKYDEK